jgi:small subunit ribosomal protein S4
VARYTGPKLELLVNLAKQYSEMTKLRRRSYPPGQHGMKKKGKKSEYAIQLMESRKLNILMEF